MRERAENGDGDGGAGRVLVVSADPALLEDLLRITAAVGAGVQVVSAPRDVGPAWRSAAAIVVGSDLAERMTRLRPPRRGGVLLVTPGEPTTGDWQHAVALGAGQVVGLATEEAELVTLLGAARRGDVGGVLVAVVGGRGGAGASVLAAGLGLAAVRRGADATLVDLDPWGGGADLLLGAEDAAGLRWGDLAGLDGPIDGRSLRTALPAPGGVTVLACDRDRSVNPSPEAALAVLEAAATVADLVVVDLPRRSDDTVAAVLAQVERTYVVVPAEVRAAAAAAQTVDALCGRGDGPVAIVVRTGRGRPLSPDLVASAMRLPLAAVVRDDSRVAAAAEDGELAVLSARNPLGRVCDSLVAALLHEGSVTAA